MKRLITQVGPFALVMVGMAAAMWLGRRPAHDGETPVDEPVVEQAALPPTPQKIINESATVIGIVVDGRARAYPLSEVWRPDRHIVNDVVGHAPVTVTYCNLEQCVNVLTSERRDAIPLGIKMGGPNPKRHRAMTVVSNGVRYDQKTGEAINDPSSKIPYPQLPFEQMSWATWRAKHPDSELYYMGRVLPAGTAGL